MLTGAPRILMGRSGESDLKSGQEPKEAGGQNKAHGQGTQEQLGEPSTDTELALICPQSESSQVCSTGSSV